MTLYTPPDKAKFGQDITAPASGVFAVTPHDTNELANYTRAIRVSVGGNVKITGVDDVATVCAFLSGETRAIRAKRIWSTGTTATGIEGMY